MIIFESLLTTFEAIVIFLGSRVSSKNLAKPQTEPPTITKFNQVKLVQISDTLCSKKRLSLDFHNQRTEKFLKNLFGFNKFRDPWKKMKSMIDKLLFPT